MTSGFAASAAIANSFVVKAIAQIDTCLETHVQTSAFSGNVVVARGSGPPVIRSYGLANREHKVLNTSRTKFRIGSITKQITAAAILHLQEKALLSTAAPVSAYLPDYPEGHRITLHHLLTHTAGIPDYLSPEQFPDIESWVRLPATLEQIVARFKDLPLVFNPGKAFLYSNSGYILLTQIIETVAGQPYADYLQTHLFEPLGMKNTGYEMPGTVIPDLAQGYCFVDQNTYLSAEPISMELPQGAGGLYSTIGDLVIWQQWLYGAASKQKLLSPKLMNLMREPFIAMDLARESLDAFYGYGLVHDTHLGYQLVYHSGRINGFSTTLAYYPEEKLTIGVLSNLENSLPEKIVEALATRFFSRLSQASSKPA